MANEQLVESVLYGGYRYPVVAFIGTGGEIIPPPAPAGISFVDASIASATGASQPIIPAAVGRIAACVSNNGPASWWINETGGVAVANGAGCFELPAGARWTPHPCPTNVVNGIGTAASKLSVALA